MGGPEHEAIRRRYIEERYRLMPYIYALAEENSRTGLPLMRPVFLEFPGQLARGENLGGTADQFMLGPDLLVAPAPTGESPYSYSITLPGAGWFDYWTGERQPEASVMETPRLDRLPVYVRPGAILPMQPLVQSTQQTPKGPLRLAVYPGPDCKGQLYFDDGVSYAYRSGAYLRQTIRCDAGAHGTTIDFARREGSYEPWWTSIDMVIHGVAAAPRQVSFGGRPIAGRYDALSRTLTIELVDVPDAARLAIDMGV